jgi:uncharacterized membrane protein YccC
MPKAFATVFRGVVRFDRAAFAPGAAARCALGVGICLAAGLLTDHVAGGFAAAVGALSVGYASFQGTYRTRAAAMVFAAAGMSISTLVGALTDEPAWLSAVMLGVWGWGVGMLSALGMTARVVGLQWAVAFIVVHQFPMTSAQAAGRSLLVLIGGLLQTVLVVSVWPLRRFAMERETLGAVYRALARYASEADDTALPPTKPLITASTRLADPQPFARDVDVQAFRALLEEAERIRVSLARLTPATAASATEPLNAIADAVEDGRAPAQVLLPDPSGTDTDTNHATLRALRSQLRTAAQLAAVPAGSESVVPQTVTDHRERDALRRSLGARRAALALRANLSLESETYRHALRLGVTLALAVVIYRTSDLPHGYWVALTVLVVLRPEFLETFIRGLARIGGTVIGAGVATLLVAALLPSQAELTVLVVVVAWLAYAVLRVNYAIFAACVTALIALLIAFFGAPEISAAKDRVLDTLVGGGLALLAYTTWPTWEAPRVRQRLAELLDLQGCYGCAVLRAYARPEAADDKALRDIQAKARLARSNAETSVDRLLAEPSSRSGDSRAALDVLGAMRRYAAAALALHAELPYRHQTHQSAELLDMVAQRLAGDLHGLASAVGTGSNIPEVSGNPGALGVDQAERMIAAVEAAAEALRRQ